MSRGMVTGPSRSEDGLTLVEMMITCVVLAVAMAATVPAVTVFYSESTAISRTYSAVDQVLLASESLNRYVREAVEPAAAVSGVPTPPFALATAEAATFYADVGSSNGPEKVVAQVTTAASGVQTLVVTGTPPDANSCPMTGSTGTQCTYQHSGPRTIADVTNLANGATPVFTYTLAGGSTTTAPSTSCTAGAGNCPLDLITGVAITLEAKNATGDTAGYQSMALLFAPAYDVAVG